MAAKFIFIRGLKNHGILLSLIIIIHDKNCHNKKTQVSSDKGLLLSKPNNCTDKEHNIEAF